MAHVSHFKTAPPPLTTRFTPRVDPHQAMKPKVLSSMSLHTSTEYDLKWTQKYISQTLACTALIALYRAA